MSNIPIYLDDPKQIMYWEADEFILIAIAVSVAIVANLFWALPLFFIVRFYRRVKDRQANGFLIHLIYWYLGFGSSEKFPTSKPLSFIRDFF